MPLSDSDVARIKGLGVSENLFVVERKGLQKLRNSMGRCVFHNGQACTIYGDRPEGCRIYPVLFDRDTKEVILDRDCSHKEEFRVAPGISHEIIRLVRRLDAERNSRLKSKGS
ncbi:YkgJ family cysteine cluster protein [Candidatus Bathyarchaeota archaeon]|nr:YkgJ family cysteine cluster protein [Candidatus Bathyarchaeota archaeon]